ncbi:MAG: YkgJ family cysteine cluster protein [Gemmatimonadaceae bacterium]
MADAIAVFEPGHQTSIPPHDVYFAFASGRFAYDCVSCGAKCCRGFGYLVTDQKELSLQTQMRRHLPLFAAETINNGIRHEYIGNCQPGCFFLSADNRCEIHAEHGYSAKPETCRLFPFNNICRVGRFLVVAPAAGVCPLQVVEPGHSNDCSDHDQLLAGMSAQGLKARIPAISCVEGHADDVIATERQVLALSEERLVHADYVTFLAMQLEITSSDTTATSSTSAVGRWIERAADLLGTPNADQIGNDATLIRAMIASTPYLRSRMVFMDPTVSRSPDRVSVRPSQVPYALLLLYLLVEAARLTGMKVITFQTVAKIQTDFAPLAWLFGESDSVMVWRRFVPIDTAGLTNADTKAAFAEISRRLQYSQQSKRPTALLDIVTQHLPADAFARVLFLKQLAQAVAGRIVPIDRLATMPTREAQQVTPLV